MLAHPANFYGYSWEENRMTKLARPAALNLNLGHQGQSWSLMSRSMVCYSNFSSKSILLVLTSVTYTYENVK